MELLIPGLILVALMVWASTKIKKTAADAFEPEFIETETYSLQKPEGFLHVIGAEEHEFMAYAKDFGKGDSTGIRQATIEIDFISGENVRAVRDSIRRAAINSELRAESGATCELLAEETANESSTSAFYKIVGAGDDVYRLRFGVLPEHKDEYLRRIDETLESFTIKTN
ncbi:MAG: hypothetical protein ABI646_03275 [Acidobacteriota bacterium]